MLKVVILLVENYKKYGIALLVLIAIGWAGYLLGVNLHSDQPGADAVRSSLQRIEDHQRRIDERLNKITAGLDQSTETAKRIAGRVEEAAGAVDNAAERITAGQRRLEASQSRIGEGIGILQTIRERNQQQNKQPAP